MKRVLLICLAILIPSAAAHAENWKNKITQPPLSASQRGIPVCLSNANCWCRSKRKTFTSGESCACGSTDGMLVYERQIPAGVAACQ
jgi:hypothetical protein